MDPEYFIGVSKEHDGFDNFVSEEMWKYFHAKHGHMSQEQLRRHWQTSKCDLLEVYCTEQSQLTYQSSKLGLRSFRFGLKQGDLSTFLGRTKLYDMLWTFRPKHIWVSPRCAPWSQWNHLNAAKSLKLENQILADKKSEKIHLLVCDSLFRLQMWRGPQFHFHLEQPQGSDMIHQHEMQNIVGNTIRVLCDMCVAGGLKHPNSHEALRKRTQVLTTSAILGRMLEKCQCVGNHHHDVIAGSCKPWGQARQSLTKFTELYTAMFGHRLGKAIQCSIQVHEKCPEYEPCFVQRTISSPDAPQTASDQEEPKRRRLFGKFHPDQIFVPIESSETHSSPEAPAERSQIPQSTEDMSSSRSLAVTQAIQMAEQCAPRVGKMVIQEGPLFEMIQEMYPDKKIVALDICRGINRMRVCPVGSKGFAPFRRMLGRRRSDLQTFEDSTWEAWETLSHRQQIRSSIPARLMITVFATNKRANPDVPEVDILPDSSKRLKNEVDVTSIKPELPSQTQNKITETTEDTMPIRCQTHGPLFRSLDQGVQQQIKKVHQNLGHPDTRVLQMALKRYGWSDKDVQGCADFVCPVCLESKMPKVARPGHLHAPRDFNDLVSFDAAEWQTEQGKVYRFFHFIDSATNFHVAIPYHQGTTEGLIDAFMTAWIRWAGPPRSVMFDSATEANSEKFAEFLKQQSIVSYVIPTEAHWQLGRAERNGAVLKHMLDKYHLEQPIQCDEDFNIGLMHLCNAKNAMSRHEGFTPELWVLGKMKPIPGSLSSGSLDSAGYAGLESQSTEGSRFHEMLARREAARVAFIKADHSATLRRALHARSRPDRLRFQIGDLVMFWREGKGTESGSWHGPAKVLMVEDRNLLWLSHLTRLYRCAPEHVRPLSEDEARSVTNADRQMLQLPERSGSGVFQYRELISQEAPPHTSPLEPPPINPNVPSTNNLHNPEPDTIILEDNPNPNNQNNPSHPGSTGQPDTEPGIPGGLFSDPNTPTEGNPTVEEPSWNVPVPDAADDELTTTHVTHDFWEIQSGKLIRHHVVPRLRTFFPSDATQCPVSIKDIGQVRTTCGTYASGSAFQRQEVWQENVSSHQPLPEPWTGCTSFELSDNAVPVQKSNDDQSSSSAQPQAFHAEINLTMEDVQKCLGKTYDFQENFLASAAKRQKVEVKMKDLSPEEIKMFRLAKDKELDSWLATDTVRRILRSKIPENQLLRSRWVLTWKALDEQEQKETGLSRKAKARLVILGYEDPQIDTLPRDSPTLGRDSRMLALQCIASHQWTVRSFDIRTAFLRGSRQDSRILGVEPPAELRCKMDLKDDEVCELLKGAYGLINAPLLWYCELKSALLSLGFIISPLDPCLFVLPKKNKPTDEPSAIHGVLGIHVDDGIGGGDKHFQQAIKALETKFPFGSQRQGSFTFTGVNIHQEYNGDILLSQKDYINDIPPIDVNRDRRKNPEMPINSSELQQLRGLIGSLQYAATNSRPDLSCRLSLLQARVTCATVADLLQGNRMLADAKKHSDVTIKIQGLPVEQVRFLSFSDAAFATREKAHSQKGCIILATTEGIDQTRHSKVSPLVWFSKKINRVVSSTLASETYALSGALDLLSWTRMHWSWILNPFIEWKKPEETLKSIPPAFAVVDCKSLFDLLQKTSIPQCTEYRTMLEALVIKDRLSEGVIVKWVHSAAQMADSLTKDMDTSVLREFLKHGKCILHDVDEILKQRADKKIRQQWYQQSSTIDAALHVFALMMELG